MKRISLILGCIIIATALAGCREQSVSRTYSANMDATWNAVVAVAQKISKDPPKLDRANRKITTGMVFSGIRDETSANKGYSETARSAKMWRAMISLKPEYGGTRVSIKVQKAGAETSGDSPGSEQKEVSIGITLSSSNTDWQHEVLDAIQKELTPKGK